METRHEAQIDAMTFLLPPLVLTMQIPRWVLGMEQERSGHARWARPSSEK